MTRPTTRHVADRPRLFAGPGRLLNFLRIARAASPHRAVLALRRGRAAPPAETRLVPFLRIGRGRRA